MIGNQYPKHIIAVTGLIRNPEHQVLMLLSPKRGWEPPGGQVDEGETLFAALERETIEETGITARIGPLVGVYSKIKPQAMVLFSFLGDFVSGHLKSSPESLATEWVDPGRVLKRIEHPATHDRVRDMLAFNSKVIYRVYTTHPYAILAERYLDEKP